MILVALTAGVIAALMLGGLIAAELDAWHWRRRQ